jgi:hypothetical protein
LPIFMDVSVTPGVWAFVVEAKAAEAAAVKVVRRVIMVCSPGSL